MNGNDDTAVPNYRRAFEEMVRDLETRSDLKLTEAELPPPAPKEVLEGARNASRGHLPSGMEAFYSQMNGVLIQWESASPSTPGEVPDQGSIQLLPLEEIFGDWKDALWFDDFEGGDRFRPVKPVDLFVTEACMALRQKAGEPPEERLYFHYIGEDLVRAECTFSRYLELLLQTRGYLYWQRILIPGTERESEVKKMRNRIKLLFPDSHLP